jgi:capsule biosynthesis phosphatase
MIETEKALVVDIDGTLCPIKREGESYDDMIPEPRMLARLKALHAEGWVIILHSARGMRSNDGNPGKIARNVTPACYAGSPPMTSPSTSCTSPSPGPGRQGFYIDDRAVRPREFVELSFDALNALVERDRIAVPGGAA